MTSLGVASLHYFVDEHQRYYASRKSSAFEPRAYEFLRLVEIGEHLAREWGHFTAADYGTAEELSQFVPGGVVEVDSAPQLADTLTIYDSAGAVERRFRAEFSTTQKQRARSRQLWKRQRHRQ